MKKYFLIIRLTFFLQALFLVSCDVHEWPLEPEHELPQPEIPKEKISLTLNLSFDKEMLQHKIVTYEELKNNTRSGEEIHDIRYIIQMFRGTRTRGTSPDFTYIFTKADDEILDLSASFQLEEGDYEVYVWTDYINKDTKTDKYYDTSNLEYITIKKDKGYPGSNEKRDCFRGFTTINVSSSDKKNNSETITILMERPVSRFEFITTDIEEFLDKETKRKSLMDSQQNSLINNDIIPEDYSIVVRYNGFVPNAYNAYTHKSVDASQNTYFESKMRQTSEGTSLGFDYVFVNESETTVNAAVSIYDNSGNIVSTSENIEIPLLRNKNTYIKGKFLSETSNGGVFVDPGYEGDYVIEIK